MLSCTTSAGLVGVLIAMKAAALIAGLTKHSPAIPTGIYLQRNRFKQGRSHARIYPGAAARVSTTLAD